MTWLTSKLTGALAAAGVVLAVAVGIYGKGRSDAASKAKAERASSRLESIKQAREVEGEVNRLDPNGVESRLSEWMRD